MRFEKLNYQDRTSALHRLYKRLNKCLFSNQLPDVVIEFQNLDERYTDTAVYGMFFPRDPYNLAQKACILFSYELADVICKQKYQAQQVETVAQIMLHEMIHLYCYAQRIDDSKHNEAWQREALNHGLCSIYEKDILQSERLLPVACVSVASFRF